MIELKKKRKEIKDVIVKRKKNFLQEKEKRVLAISEDEELILGLDISKSSTGIAIITKKKELLFYINYKPSDSKDIKDVAYEYSFLVDYLMSVYPTIKTCIIEDTFISPMSKGSSVKDLSIVQGAFLVNLLMYNVELKKITNTSAKASFGAKNHGKKTDPHFIASKEVLFNIIKQAYNLTDFEFKTENDITDAIALACNFDNKSVIEKTKTVKGQKVKYYVDTLKEY